MSCVAAGSVPTRRRAGLGGSDSGRQSEIGELMSHRMRNAGSCVRFTSLVQWEPWFRWRQANTLLDLFPFSVFFLGELTVLGRDC